MYLFKELLFFLKKAKIERVNLNKQIFKSSIQQFIIFDFIVVLIGTFLIAITFIFYGDFKEVLATKNIFSGFSFVKSIFYFCIIGPLIEELTFRVGLKINRLNIAVFLGFNVMVILKIAGIIQQSLIVWLLFALLSSLIFFLSLKDRHLNFFKKYYYLFLYYNILFFALVHIGNYSFPHPFQYLFVPILIFVQFFLGIYLSYSRLKYGFLFALFIHFFHNLINVILNALF